MRSLWPFAFLLLLGPVGLAAEKIPAEIVKSLEDSDPAVRVKAIKQLSKLGLEAVPPLVKALKDEEVGVHQAAAYALRLLKADPDALAAALKDHAADANVNVRKGVLGALGRCGTAGLPTMLAGLKDSDAGVRTTVAKNLPPILAKTPDASKEVLPALEKALQDESPAVRLDVVRLLPRCGKGAVPLLLRAASDSDPVVRAHALAGLIPLKPPVKEILPIASKCLEDADSNVKQSALRTLGALGGPDVVGPIAGALKDREPIVQKAAVMSLLKLGKEALPALAGLKEVAEKAENASVRTSAINALGQLGEKGESAIVELLNRDDSATRLACLQHFGRSGKAPKAIVPATVKALADEEGGVRALAVHTLGLIGPDAKEALPALEKVKKDDPEPAVRMLAEKAIGAIKKE